MAMTATRNLGAAFRYLFKGPTHQYPGIDAAEVGGFDHCISNSVAIAAADSSDSNAINLVSVDSNNIPHVNRQGFVGCRIPVRFYLPAAGALATQTIFIADRTMTVTAIEELHSAAETATGTATLTITKDTGVSATGSGTALMSNTINLKATANTLQTGTLLTAQANGDPNAGLQLAAGDRLSVKVGGTATITALAGVVVTVWLSPGYVEQIAAFQQKGASPATAGFFMANRDYIVTGVKVWYSHAGGAACVIDITKDTGTNAPGAGTSILSATVDATAAANTVYSGALAASAATLKLAAGDRLSYKPGGTTTGLAGVVVDVYLTAVNPTTEAATSQSKYCGQVDVVWNMAATLASGGFFIADRDYEVVDVSGIWSTASGGGGTATITIDKGVTAPAGGTAVLTGTLDLSTSANTTNVGVLNVSRRTRLMSAGDLLSAKIASASSTAGATLTVSLLPR